jgi:hypothetical protein
MSRVALLVALLVCRDGFQLFENPIVPEIPASISDKTRAEVSLAENVAWSVLLNQISDTSVSPLLLLGAMSSRSREGNATLVVAS